MNPHGERVLLLEVGRRHVARGLQTDADDLRRGVAEQVDVNGAELAV